MPIFFAAPIDKYPDYNRVINVPTCPTTQANFPASNLVTYDPTQPMISTITNPVITWNFGEVREFDVVSLIHTNLPTFATLGIEGSLDGATWTVIVNAGTVALAHPLPGGSAAVNLGNMLRKNLTLYNSATVQSYQYIRLSVDSQSGVLPSLGRLFVGKKFVPSSGWQYGSSFTFLDLSKRERTERGALILDPLPVIVGANVKMEFLTKSEMLDFVFEFNYWRGAAREILACLDTLDSIHLQKNTLYCTISEGRQISFDSYNTHSAMWVLESIA